MYQPSEDSYLLSDGLKKVIRKFKPLTFLDMGCGSGIQSKTAIESGIDKKNILAVDIDDDALKETGKLQVRTLKSNLFSSVKGRFDLIAFNPPYLPADRHDKLKDTTGGRLGFETIARFLKQAKKFLNENGKILLLFSSLTNKEKVIELINMNKFYFEQVASKKLGFEELYVYLVY